LQEEHLPIVGWPRKRIEGWWRDFWVCPWFQQTGDLLEPWLLLPCLFMLTWLAVLLRRQTILDTGVVLVLATILTVVIFSVFCVVLVWSQGKDEERNE